MIPSSPHADAILATLRSAGLVVGDAERPRDLPEDPSDPAWQPYLVLWMDTGGTADGHLADGDVDGDVRFTLTAIGRLAAEARKVRDDAATALEGGFTVPGRSIQNLRQLQPFIGVQHDTAVEPPVFYVPCTYGFRSFPNP